MKRFALIPILLAVGGVTLAVLEFTADPAEARPIATPIARPTANSLTVEGYCFLRSGEDTVIATVGFSDGTVSRAYTLPSRNTSGASGGIRINATTGEPEQFTPAGLATARDTTRNAFTNTSGTVAARLDAVDVAMRAGGDARLPP